MCDDFFEDTFEDNFFDPDNDFQEDLVDEYAFDDTDNLFNDKPNNKESGKSQEDRLYDAAEILIFGSMIFGNAYEEGIDEKRRKQAVEGDKDKKE